LIVLLFVRSLATPGVVIPDVRFDANGLVIHEITTSGLVAFGVFILYILRSIVLFRQERNRRGADYLALSLLILLLGVAFRSFIYAPFPILSFSNALSAMMLAYGVISQQIFNPLRERTVELSREMEERKEAEKALEKSLGALRESEAKYRLLAENISDVIWTVDMDLNVTYISPSVYRTRGYTPGEAMQLKLTDHLTPDSMALAASVLAKELAVEAQEGIDLKRTRTLQLEFLRKDRSTYWGEVNLTFIRDTEGKATGILGVSRDINERKRAEEALRVSEARFRDMADMLPQAVYETDTQGILTYANRYAFDLFGYTREDFEKGLNVFQMIVPEDRERAGSAIQAVLTGNPPSIDRKYRALRKDGTSFPVANYSSPIVHKDSTSGLRGILVDMTEHEKAKEEKERLQAQLIQAQKMESVGRLAGGVAHDFNNMLGTIIGNAELAKMQMDPADPLSKHIREILKASSRSADLVRQLLAFARKQTVSPKVLDLNDTLEGMLKMLRRLIGEDIELHWIPGQDLWPVRIDPSQIDQIMANLAVNARDAIVGVGKLTIETKKMTLDEAYCSDHPGFVPGQYSVLAVSDDGVGMSKDVLENIFEPFFTTKEVGKGTGLGLATVYGIVKQNNGFINVYSEPGTGTTFRIYFPRFQGEVDAAPETVDVKALPRGSETVLLAEDEGPLMNIARDILTRLGYTVLAASKPSEALSLAESHLGEIHLLLTDVVMPEMNGRELLEKLHTRRPGMKSLFMSGYTANVVAHHGVLEEGVHFIEKPFSPRALAEKVREVLDKG
jgi:two-component system cell cycle sensor histidine kinase/response regulator CckA